MTSARAWSNFSDCSLGRLLIGEPMSHICNSFASLAQQSVHCVLGFFFFFALHLERRVCRTWLREVGLISVWPAELELLAISDNRGAVPACTGRDLTGLLSCTWSFYGRLTPSALARLKTVTSLCCQVKFFIMLYDFFLTVLNGVSLNEWNVFTR